MHYGTKLRHTRERIGIKQKDLAKELNIIDSLYSKYESEYQIIPLKHLVTVTNILKVSIDYLFGFTDKVCYKNYKKEIDRVTVGKRIRAWRKENKITQVQLATVLKTVHPVIVNYENGKNLITTSFLYELCKHYKISADYILGRIDKKVIFKD